MDTIPFDHGTTGRRIDGPAVGHVADTKGRTMAYPRTNVPRTEFRGGLPWTVGPGNKRRQGRHAAGATGQRQPEGREADDVE